MLCIDHLKDTKIAHIDIKLLKYNVSVIIFYKNTSVSMATILKKQPTTYFKVEKLQLQDKAKKPTKSSVLAKYVVNFY